MSPLNIHKKRSRHLKISLKPTNGHTNHPPLPPHNTHPNSYPTPKPPKLRSNISNLPTGAQHPFLTSYEGILKLENNLPPLTQFTLDNETQRTYEKYEHLLNDLKQRLKTEKLQILQADKGLGLLLIHNNSLRDMYNEYLKQKATQITPDGYVTILIKLQMSLSRTTKMKQTSTTTGHLEIFTYSNGVKELAEISRLIIDHRNSITSQCSSFLRHLITPINQHCSYLTKDIHETIGSLCTNGTPHYIHTRDIEQLYPNTPPQPYTGSVHLLQSKQ